MNIVDESPIDNVTLKVTDGEDREWNEDNVPNPLRRVIEKSLRKGQLDGTVAAAGRLFRWHAVLGDQVSLQFDAPRPCRAGNPDSCDRLVRVPAARSSSRRRSAPVVGRNTRQRDERWHLA